MEIAELQAPSTGLFTASQISVLQGTPRALKPPNVYYHLDKSIRHVNVDLGFCVSLSSTMELFGMTPMRSMVQTTPLTGGNLNFWEGGVDDAEDMDVILHELGHGLHDWLPTGTFPK